MNVSSISGAAPAAPTTSAPAGPASAGENLLPPPELTPSDSLLALHALFSKLSHVRQADAKTNATAHAEKRQSVLEEQREALRRAQEAAADKGGFFDSIGLGGLAGIAIGNPWLVVADMGMHMAKLTPDALRDFEKSHLDEIARATDAFGALGHAKVLLEKGLGGPHAIAAMVALGGLLVEETKLLGEETSDWAGRGMVLGASGGSRDALVALAADKKSAVADGIRHVEEETRDYTKYAAYAAMGLAAVGAVAGTLGTAAVPVVIVGIALSTSGAIVSETQCFGEASSWVSLGLMASGALVSGAGVAHAAGKVSAAAAKVASASSAASSSIDGATKLKQGAEQLQHAAVTRDVERARIDAKEHRLAAERLGRMIDELIEVAEDAKDGFRRLAETVQSCIDERDRTSLLIAGALKG